MLAGEKEGMMNSTLFKIMNIGTYILGIFALLMLIAKIFFHYFSNDDVIALVLVSVILKLLMLRFPPHRKGGSA